MATFNRLDSVKTMIIIILGQCIDKTTKNYDRITYLSILLTVFPFVFSFFLFSSDSTGFPNALNENQFTLATLHKLTIQKEEDNGERERERKKCKNILRSSYFKVNRNQKENVTRNISYIYIKRNHSL